MGGGINYQYIQQIRHRGLEILMPFTNWVSTKTCAFNSTGYELAPNYPRFIEIIRRRGSAKVWRCCVACGNTSVDCAPAAASIPVDMATILARDDSVSRKD